MLYLNFFFISWSHIIDKTTHRKIYETYITRFFRKQNGLTQQTLAELSGQEPSNISHIERGATKLGSPTIINIANVLNVTVDELLCDSLTKSKHLFTNEIDSLLLDCTDDEIRFFAASLRDLKENFRKYR